MTTLEKVIEKLGKEPSLYDIKSYTDTWSEEELNILMIAEYSEVISGLSTKLDRSEFAVIAKYLELRNSLDGLVAFDYRIAPAGTEMYKFDRNYNLDDFTKDVSVIQAKVGDIVLINIRLLAPEWQAAKPSDQDGVAGFMEYKTPPVVGDFFISQNKGGDSTYQATYDPARYSLIMASIVGVGVGQCGLQLKFRGNFTIEQGLKKTLIIEVTE